MRRLCVLAIAVLAPLQVLALSRHAPTPPAPANPASGDAAREPRPWTPPPPPGPGRATIPAQTASPRLVTEPDVVPAAAPAAAHAGRSPATLAQRYPAQAAAVQRADDPATTRWALLIGINEHLGRVGDNIGSRQDAEDLRQVLLTEGWRDDHILLITDRAATRATILAGIAWLADKTDQDSVAVFHYSGHSKKWYGQDHDGDGEVTDEGLWPTDDRFIPDSELVRAMAPVAPHALWMNVATCNAAGFADPGLARPGRLLTFSSGEPQKSYEHPDWGNSVWGWFLIEQAMARGRADLDADGRVTVEEAFTWARPRASRTTAGQSDGPQDAVVVDLVAGDFDLEIPRRVPATTRSADAPTGQQPPDGHPRAPGGADDDGRGRLCLLCG